MKSGWDRERRDGEESRMTVYDGSALLRLAKRHHNTKRNYLLVNPLQGKHMPVSPGEALAMMAALGEKLAAQRPEIDLVIGFAETATAVAAAAAAAMGRPCRYIHTTREDTVPGEAVEFREEHSHAVEQRLILTRLGHWIDGASSVALVDDELSTGRTMANAIRQLTRACPSLATKPLVIASVISRLEGEGIEGLEDRSVRCLSLLRLPAGDYSAAVRRFEIDEAEAPRGGRMSYAEARLAMEGRDARVGVALPDWTRALEKASDRLLASLAESLRGQRIVVLGTEEYMLPGLVLGARLETMGIACGVRFHATTRSPIGICRDEGYPICAGWRLRSFYDPRRVTYIYDLMPCDTALVVTDSRDDDAVAHAMEDLTAALAEAGCGRVVLIREE